MRCDYAHDDGAYVLGALSPQERSAYERHLGTCPACREAVAEIAVLPGLLGRLDPATALQLLSDQSVDGPLETSWPPPAADRGDIGEGRVTSLVGKAAQARRRERQSRRLRYASAAMVAACMALVAAFGVGILRDGPTSPVPGPETSTQPEVVQMAAMSTVADDVPITAKVGLAARSWGTEITMDCSYERSDQYKKAWRLKLVARGPDNETEQVGSWVASPGKPVQFEGATRFVGDQLVRLELVRADGTTLLAYDVP